MLIGPTPPPYAGPEIFYEAMLPRVKSLDGSFRIVHVSSNIRKENLKKGTLDFEGLVAFLKVYRKFLIQLMKSRPKLVYLPLASGKIGFLRDAVIIWTSAVLRRRIVLHYHGGNFNNFYGKSASWLKKAITISLRLVDTVIVLGQNLGFMFEGLVPKENIRVLYNGIDAEGYKGLQRHPSNSKVTILFMGHLTYPKGFWHLTKAYCRLREKYPNMQFQFAGALPEATGNVAEFLSGSDREDFQNRMGEITEETLRFIKDADQYGATYLGFVTGKAKMDALARADIFVLSSFTEGFPMSVLEAMAAGLPVVVTPVGVLPEILKEGENCLFVKAGDADDLEAKIEILVRDEELRRRMGESNRELAIRELDIKLVAENLVHIFEETVSARG